MDKHKLLLVLMKEILGEPLKYNNTREQYSFNCPTCAAEKGVEADGKGNLEVNLQKGVYHCWSCGETHGTHGSLPKMVKFFGSEKQVKRLSVLGFKIKKNKVELDVDKIELPEGFKSFKTENPKSIEYKQAWNYLKKRGITKEIAFKHNMGYVLKGEYGGRIIIPSYDKDGEINYFVSRTYTNQRPKYKNPDSQKFTPKEEIIFNEKFINWDGTVYLVEGPFDHIVLHNSIPMLGKVISPKLQMEILEKLKGDLVLLLDSDAWNDLKRLYAKLNVGRLHGKIRVIKLNEGYDISKIQELLGRKGIVDVLRSSYKLKEYEY
jgi:DNA primase